jgi:cation-transporting ATPase I
MSVAATQEPRLVHAIPGRVRIHLPGWSGQGQRALERQLRALPPVRSVQANGLTGNVLVIFDPATDERTIVAAARRIAADITAASEAAGAPAPPLRRVADAPSRPSVPRERRGKTVRARIPVPGLDRNPHLARRVVERLQQNPGVRVVAAPLTGRVLVEFTEHEADLDNLIAQITDLDLPDLPGEDRPDDPLDPKPLVQGATRTVGAALGFSLLAAQQLPGVPSPLVNPTTGAQISGTISLLRGFPWLRNGLRQLLGRNVADLAFTLPDIITLALSNNPLGLAVSGAEALRLLTEVVARRAAWRRYSERLQTSEAATPGAVIRLETGERVPMAARVIEGTGTATARSGLPVAVAPGGHVPASSRLFGGPFVLELEPGNAFAPQPRPAPLRPTLYERYNRVIAPASLGYAVLTAILTRSVGRTFAALLLVNPRAAVVGLEAADLDASARVLRAGVVVVDTRRDRVIRRPDLMLLDGPRVVTDRLEITSVVPLVATIDTPELLARVGGVAGAAGSPWGGAFRTAGSVPATDGHFDGHTATAQVAGTTYTLGPIEDWSAVPAAARLRHRGHYVLQLRSSRAAGPLGLIALRPQLAPGIERLVEICRRHGVTLALLPGDDDLTARGVAQRAGILVLDGDDALDAIRSRQARGDHVAFVSDGGHAAEAFAACDLAIALSDGRAPLAARADLLAPDLESVAAIVEAGAQRDLAVRDAVGLSMLANGFGAVWGFRGAPGIEIASRGVLVTALAALGDGWLRLRGGQRPRSALAAIVDPRPERWGRQSVERVLHGLGTTEKGLTSAEAARRQRSAPPTLQHRTLWSALLDQLRSPLTGILAAGAGLSLFLGAPADVAIIGATLMANVCIGAWQERKANQVTETLAQLGAARARVLRDGQLTTVPAHEVVPGDILLLAPGDHVAADARMLSAQGLEVDEAALTGESLPVAKSPHAVTDAARIVLDGSDVTAGNGKAVAVAVGRYTRMGSIAAALTVEDVRQSPLDTRLSQLLRQVLPLAVAGGAIVAVSGFLRTRSILPQLAIGATIAVSAVPEGLPLLTQVSEAGVARRLASRHALTRHLPAVEALGRVDVACTDKTGTLTEGRLALTLIASADGGEATLPNGHLSADLRATLLTAALASPRPDAADATAHPTDVAVVSGAEELGLGDALRQARVSELPFDPMRAFHATLLHDRLCLKGAPEALVPRCTSIHRDGQTTPLDEEGRTQLLAHAHTLAERGLRVLIVAQSPADTPPDDPHHLEVLGFLGISDPLKPTVRAAVRRCREAGVRVIMLTGDHPATARAIAREAGLLDGDVDDADAVVTGAEIAELQNGELDARLERAIVIARATPLDKVRIVESLQRHGHTVAMTGDGVNDAPALRLADVGVAMGRGGTEVARQTADVVLADDDFATLVETFVEGRSFWQNIRRAIGLLLGGNLGELGLVVIASALGLAAPLTARQVLVVNMITDILPGLAVALQQPEHRHLAGLAREGTAALDKPLRNEVLRRGALTAGPSLAAYLLALATETLPQARTVAFASVVATQLAQTLDVGWAEGSLTPPVMGAVGGSAALLGSALLVPQLRTFLGLALPTPFGWGLIAGGALLAMLVSRLLAVRPQLAPGRPRLYALPAPIT